MEGFTLKCNKCGEKVVFNKSNFYSNQWDENGNWSKLLLGVNWNQGNVDIECKCGNQIES